MLKRMIAVGGTVFLVLATSLAQAQEQKRERGQGRGQGRGGFGFAFGGGFGGPGGGAGQLLGTPEVQKELGISDEQKGLIDDMLAGLREEGQKVFGSFNPQDFQNLTDEERQKRREEVGKKFEELNKKTEENVAMILEPKQLDRLNQLRLQREGIRAFGRDDVAEKLGLSAEQREKINAIFESLRPDPSQFRNFNFQNLSDEDRAKLREQGEQMRQKGEQARTDIVNLLTPEQKEKWEAMQGKKFDFPPSRGFGGGPGGPGGDGPRRKRGNE
jgi:hypothetical protein